MLQHQKEWVHFCSSFLFFFSPLCTSACLVYLRVILPISATQADVINQRYALQKVFSTAGEERTLVRGVATASTERVASPELARSLHPLKDDAERRQIFRVLQLQRRACRLRIETSAGCVTRLISWSFSRLVEILPDIISCLGLTRVIC